MTTENKMTPVEAALACETLSGKAPAYMTREERELRKQYQSVLQPLSQDGDGVLCTAFTILAAEVRRLREERDAWKEHFESCSSSLKLADKSNEELAALRDGFDPKVKLPEEGVKVLIRDNSDDFHVADYSQLDCSFDICGGWVTMDECCRWWHLPSSK